MKKVKVLTFENSKLVSESEVDVPDPVPTIDDRVKVLEDTVKDLDLAR